MLPPRTWNCLSLCLRSNIRTRHQFARTSTRHYSTDNDFSELPPLNDWRAVFLPYHLHVRDRVSLRNPQTADILAKSYFGNKSIAHGSGKIVIESFPGPGQLSRALLRLPSSQVKKLIILEDHEPYLKYLRPLAADPRVTIVEKTGFDWDTYQVLEEQGLLDEVETLSYADGVHPQLHFVSHIPHTVKGEQLVAQLFRCIPSKSWLFKYGRVPMSLILGQWMWERITAPPTTIARCKVGVIAEASASLQNSVRMSVLLPYDDHFHPVVARTPTKRPESRRSGAPLVSVNIVPFAEQIIAPDALDAWDYILRRLFVLKSTPLERAIGSLAAGATVLLKAITDETLPPDQRVDVTKRIKDLTIRDWALLAQAFDNWPFAPNPDDLVISGSFNGANLNENR